MSRLAPAIGVIQLLVVGSLPAQRYEAPRFATSAASPASPDSPASPFSPVGAPSITRVAAGLAAGSPADRRPQPWLPPLASLVVPGAGQARLGQDRFIPYLALEAWAWIRFTVDQRDGRRSRREYRELARRVARSAFGTATPPGPFEYYERMEKWVESGAYDLVAGGTLDPETDTLTFNGAQWLLARRTFWPDPDNPPPATSNEYRDAIAFYSSRAIGPLYRWSWRDAQLEQDLFRRTIGRSNDAFRHAGTDLGIILANHVFSMVDALATVRLRHRRQARESELGLEVTVPFNAVRTQ